MRKTVAIVPFGNIDHPEIEGDDLFHQAAVMARLDKKKRFVGWYAINFAAMLTEDVVAVVPNGNGLGTQTLKELLNRFCEPFFIPNEVQSVHCSVTSPTLTQQVQDAIALHPEADDFVLIMPDQLLEVTSSTLMMFRNGAVVALLAPTVNARKAPHSEKKQVYVAPVEASGADQAKEVMSYEQAAELGTLEIFKGVVSAVRFDAYDLKLALDAGKTVEEHMVTAIKNQQVGKVDARQGFY